jgi:hypothetical protein
MSWPGTGPMVLAGAGALGGGGPAPWAGHANLQQQQVAALLVTLNRVLQEVTPRMPMAAGVIPAVQEAVNAYGIGAFAQAYWLAQAAAGQLDVLLQQSQMGGWMGWPPGS